MEVNGPSLALAIIVVVFAVFLVVRKAKANIAAEHRLASKYKFDDLYVSSDDQSLIGIAFATQTIVLGYLGNEVEYDFDQISATEIVEDGSIITQTNRGSQLIGAALGSIAFGPAGAVIGGLSGKTRTRGRLKTLSLKVTVDDPEQPIYTIYFIKNSEGVDPDGFIATNSRQQIERMRAHVVNAMRCAAETRETPMVGRPTVPRRRRMPVRKLRRKQTDNPKEQ